MYDGVENRLVAYELIEKLCKEEASKPYDERDSGELVADIISKLSDDGATFRKYFNLDD